MTLSNFRWAARAMASAAVLIGFVAPLPAQTARTADSAKAPNPADVKFMTDMIAHHAQAVVIGKWVPSHGTSEELKTLASRVVLSQKDEIALMSNWLRDHGQPVPEVDTTGAGLHGMSGMAGMHDMPHMAGMLSHDQLVELDSTRGPAFDQLWLRDMIGHHKGALTMVHDLFESEGAARDDGVYTLASNIEYDQSTEIERMQKMLAAMLVESWKKQP